MNLFHEHQGGFRPKDLTVRTCSYFVNDLYNAINNNKFTIAVYIDAMKAFDTVNHAILLEMSLLGIKGNLLSWIENYLTGRYQCTQATNIVSNEKCITCGVPQESVLGPLLFLIYINDIAKSIINSKVSLYANDMLLYISHSDFESAIRLIQSDLDSVYTWCDSNKLTINCEKTKYFIMV